MSNEITRDIIPVFCVELHDSLFDFPQYDFVRRTKKWRIASEKQVKNHSTRPNVTRLVVLALQNLRGDIIARAELLSHFGVGVVVVGSAEVNDFDEAVVLPRVVEDVFWFQVTMDNLVGVDVVKGRDHLPDSPSRFFFRESLLQVNPLVKLSSLAKFSDDVEVGVVLEELQDFYDVRVVASLEDVDFIDESVLVVARSPSFLNDLDCPLQIAHFVDGLLDFPVRAFPQLRQKKIVFRFNVALFLNNEVRGTHFEILDAFDFCCF